MERGEEAIGMKVELFQHHKEIEHCAISMIKVEEEDLVTVCLWASCN